MAEDRDRVRRLIIKLREQLAAAAPVEVNLRRDLEATVADLEQALAGESLATAPAGSAERLGKAAAQFEASHPTLAGTIGAIIDAVGRAGI
jgi:hypothetical protein